MNTQPKLFPSFLNGIVKSTPLYLLIDMSHDTKALDSLTISYTGRNKEISCFVFGCVSVFPAFHLTRLEVTGVCNYFTFPLCIEPNVRRHQSFLFNVFFKRLIVHASKHHQSIFATLFRSLFLHLRCILARIQTFSCLLSLVFSTKTGWQ